MFAYVICKTDYDLYSGVAAKVDAQVRGLCVAGIDFEIVRVTQNRSMAGKFLRRIPLLPDGSHWGKTDVSRYDGFYVRRPGFISSDLIRFFSKVRRDSSTIPIVMELPTYPYDEEMKTLARYPLLLRDRWNRRKLKGVVDRIADLSGADEIFGIPTLHIINGVDLDVVRPRRPAGTTPAGDVRLMCVATFAEWHGVDRVLEGMREYYAGSPDRRVVLELLGDGPDVERLQKLVSEYGLGDVVRFHGRCDRGQMDAAYDRCSLAIECLGNHRKGIALSSSLKSREYLAKGVPFVYSGEIDVFDEDPVDFCLNVPPDESPIDIHRLVRFHDELYGRYGEEALISEIRSYAERHVSMDKAMANVIDYFKEAMDEQS